MTTSVPAFSAPLPLATASRYPYAGSRTKLKRSATVFRRAPEVSRTICNVVSNESLAVPGTESTNSVAKTFIEDDADGSESGIQSMDDIKELIELVDEFDLYDFRIADNGVAVEISRSGGRGFEDGKLASVPAPTVYTAPPEGYQVAPDVQYVSGGEEGAYEEGEEDVEDEEAAAGPDTSDPDAVLDSDFVVKSNRVGFFFSGAKNKPPLVNVGDHVTFNQPVCIIEQLGQQYVYLSEASGTVLKIFVEDGDAVEYGQRVMNIRPD